MEYSIKRQWPYVIALTVLTWLYQYEINGCLIAWQAILCLPFNILALWGYRKLVRPVPEFSALELLKRYGPLTVILTAVNAYTFYIAHHYIYVANIAISVVNMVVMFVIMERSLHE